MRIGVEIGGTFTDLVMAENGRLRTVKVPSVGRHPEQGAFAALELLGEPLGKVDDLIHGSTVATNAVIERSAARVALVTTRGFRDLLELQREWKSRNYDLFYQRTLPLVPRERVIEAAERLEASGEVVEPLDEAALIDALEELFEREPVEALAVCLLHSYLNPVHEQRVREVVAERWPELRVSISSEIVPEFREYERASTTVMNAYLAPVVESYLGRFRGWLGEQGFRGRFHLMQSNGGTLPAGQAGQYAVRTCFSGPAAGVIGATHLAAASGVRDLITFDMGGTSTDVSLVSGGAPTTSTGTEIDRLPILVPMIDITTIGAGGGSIAAVDSGGMLHVGPQSAGADPGPACYGRGGTRATLTDAHVVRGLIRPNRFLGGRMKLDVEAARRAVAEVGARLGLPLHQAAEAIERVATNNMIQATRLVSVERGYDPRSYTLAAFGGAGPLHAAALAEDLQLRGALVPPEPGLVSAFGLLAADFRRDYVRTSVARLDDLTSADLLRHLEALQALARDELASLSMEGEAKESIALDLRYLGQGYELSVPWTLGELRAGGAEALAGLFHRAHEQQYGYSAPTEPLQIVNYRLTVTIGGVPPSLQNDRHAPPRPPEAGEILLRGAMVPCRFVDRQGLEVDRPLRGAAVVEDDTATTFVPPGWQARLDAAGNLLLDRSAGGIDD